MGVEDMESAPPSDSTQSQDAFSATEANTGAVSSSAPEGEKFDLLSVVRDAVAKPAGGDAASPVGQGESNPSTDAETEGNSAETDPEDDSDLPPFHAHPRFRQLVQRVKSAEHNAQQFESIQGFLRSQDISDEEAANALKLTGLMKHDPQAAWAQLKPIVQQLMIDAGVMLPPDLGQKVKDGGLSREHAMEMSRLRAQVGTSTKAVETQRQNQESARQAETYRTIAVEVGQWEKQVKERDPDYPVKYPLLQREILWLKQSEGVPKTPKDVRAQLQKAYDSVNSQVMVNQPRQQMRPVTGGRTASQQPIAKPTSIMDIVRAQSSA